MRKSAATSRFSLDGDWTIAGITEQFPRLSQQLSRLSTPPPATKRSATIPPPEIDLAGISALDACGCQLLANFAHALHHCGISPRFINLPDAFQGTVRLLGFARELSPSF